MLVAWSVDGRRNIRPFRRVSLTMYPGKIRGRESRTYQLTANTAGNAAHPGAICFPRAWAGIGGPRVAGIDLDEPRAVALAELLQVLSCGEESATATFEHLAQAADEPASRAALLEIAADERRHQFLLATISAALPRPQAESGFEARLRRFFMRLADRDVRVHFVRVAALDSAACQFLSLLRARTGLLASDSHAAAVLKRIHTDEARHVRIARRCAGPLVHTRRGMEIVAEVRGELAQLVSMRADSLETLSIDPDRLDARLRSVPGISRAERFWS
jgi:hypothetical protein